MSIRSVPACLALATLLACGGDASGPAPAALQFLQFAAPAASVAWGDTARLALVGLVGTAAWSSADPSVVAVDATGLLSARRAGTARVTARDGTRSASVDVTVEARFTALAAGLDATCGVVASGRLLCWGAVFDSATTGEPRLRSTPDAAPGIVSAPVASVTLGRGLTAFARGPGGVGCAALRAGATVCWGQGYQGELGVGPPTIDMLAPPRAVQAPAAFARVAAGYSHVCALTADGAASCWGVVGRGALGSAASNATCAGGGKNGTPCQTLPAPVSTAERFRQLAPGGRHTCALSVASRLFCWGAGTAAGAASEGAWLTTPAPQGADTYTAVAAGYDHTCGITTAGVAHCWGNGHLGRLGRETGDSAGYPDPTPVAGSGRYVAIAASTGFSCAAAIDGGVHCWGANDWGQLGDGTTAPHATPTPVRATLTGGHRIVALTAGAAHVCALADDGAAFCWGQNTQGQLGNGVLASSSEPVRVGAPR